MDDWDDLLSSMQWPSPSTSSSVTPRASPRAKPRDTRSLLDDKRDNNVLVTRSPRHLEVKSDSNGVVSVTKASDFTIYVQKIDQKFGAQLSEFNSTPSVQHTVTSKDFKPLVRFRRAVKTVLLLLKATAGSRHGKEKDLMSWPEMADEQSTARRTYDLFGVSFDPSIFKAKREKSLANEAKAMLTLCPYDRTDDQIKLILLALNETVDAFGEFPINLQQSLASRGWYENFEAKRVIIREGHKADNFYFILSGTAVVTKLETNPETGEHSARAVAFLKKGNSFGELALMHGACRSATVTCKTNVELLAVSREDFVDIFMPVDKDIEPEHIQFLRSLELLKGWPIEKLPNHPRFCLFTYFRRGTLLCKDSNTADWVYVIKTGSCRVLKDLLETRPNIRGLEMIQYSPGQKNSTKLPSISSVKSKESLRRNRRASVPSYGQITPQAHITSQKRHPVYFKRSSQKLNISFNPSTEHQIQLNEIHEKRHKVARQEKHLDDLIQHNDNNNNNNNNNNKEKTDRDKVFVQIQKLEARDTFGLEQSVFGLIGQATGCSLVSDGAECILINKKFFMQHLTVEIEKQIRETIRPIPSEASLQQKLQDKTNWDAYKTMTISNYVGFKRQLHDHGADALYY